MPWRRLRRKQQPGNERHLQPGNSPYVTGRRFLRLFARPLLLRFRGRARRDDCGRAIQHRGKCDLHHAHQCRRQPAHSLCVGGHAYHSRYGQQGGLRQLQPAPGCRTDADHRLSLSARYVEMEPQEGDRSEWRPHWRRHRYESCRTTGAGRQHRHARLQCDSRIQRRRIDPTMRSCKRLLGGWPSTCRHAVRR